MIYVKSVRASMYLCRTGKSENRLGEQVAGGDALPRAPQLDEPRSKPSGYTQLERVVGRKSVREPVIC